MNTIPLNFFSYNQQFPPIYPVGQYGMTSFDEVLSFELKRK